MKMHYNILGSMTVLGLVASMGAAHAQGVIKIGEINSYTGPLAAFTQPYRNGWELAVEQVNTEGGVLGRKLEVVARDDGGKPADGARERIHQEFHGDSMGSVCWNRCASPAMKPATSVR